MEITIQDIVLLLGALGGAGFGGKLLLPVIKEWIGSKKELHRLLLQEQTYKEKILELSSKVVSRTGKMKMAFEEKEAALKQLHELEIKLAIIQERLANYMLHSRGDKNPSKNNGKGV